LIREDLLNDNYSFKLDDRIRIIKHKAEGGMGSVFKAVYEGVHGFEKLVALKVLKLKASAEERSVRYFINEAKLVARLVHENIVQLHHLGVHKKHYYIVYEYISGTTLHDFIEVHRVLKHPIPRDLAVYIISRIARAIHFAHTSMDQFGQPCNIVHRDICPRNIMLSTGGQPKLTDFGIAIARDFDVNYADDMALVGKPLYMSPEQACGGNVDFRSDIYSLGIVFFQLLSGKPTRNSIKGMDDVLYQAREGQVHWHWLKDDPGADIHAILSRMLERDPANRYCDTRELVVDLEKSIFSKGYGPTSSDLSEYLRLQMPHIFDNSDKHCKPQVKRDDLVDTQLI